MNKTALAVAVAGALGALAAPTAQAQTSTVSIGGSLTVFYYTHSPNNTTPQLSNAGGVGASGKRGDILESSEPELRIMVEEALGGGLSAWFQCASSMDAFVQGAQAAFGLCARNSGVGFKGGWGNFFVGNWDTPQKNVQTRIRGWNGSTNSFTGGVGNLLFGGSASGTNNPTQAITNNLGNSTTGVVSVGLTTATSNTPGSFSRRQAQTLNYYSPNWSGFSFQGAYSAANETTGISPTAVPSLKPRLWSLSGAYENGPLYLGIGYERHKDYNPGNTTQGVAAGTYSGGRDNNWMLGASYTFAGVFKLSGEYSRSKYTTTNTTNLSVHGWWLFADWAISGPHSLKAQYGRVSDSSGTATQAVGTYRAPLLVGTAAGTSGCGPALPGGAGSNAGSIFPQGACATDTGAKQYGLWYAYDFSKRTQVFLGFNKVDNDSNAIFSLGKTVPTAGASQTVIGVGMKHSF